MGELVESLEFACRDDRGVLIGNLVIADASKKPSLEWDMATEQISIAENGQYHLLFRPAAGQALDFAAPVQMSPVQAAGEAFGVLERRPGLGFFPLSLVTASHETVWSRRVTIRSSKLGERAEFEQMVEEVCNWRTSLAVDLSSESSASWSHDKHERRISPEEQLVVLRDAFNRWNVFDAFERVRANSSAKLMRSDESGNFGHQQADPARLARHLSSPGERIRVPAGHKLYALLNSLPAQVPLKKQVESIDTSENQFVKFALA